MSVRDLRYDITISVSKKDNQKEFDHEIYDEWFSEKYSFETAEQMWRDNHTFEFPDLNSSMQDSIIKKILHTSERYDQMYNRHSDENHYFETGGDYGIYLDERQEDELIPYIFNDPTVSEEGKAKILEQYQRTGDGYGFIEFDDDRIHYCEAEVLHKDDGYYVGTVSVNQDVYSFEYNTDTEEFDVHKYSEPGFFTGSSYEMPLPSEFSNPHNCAQIVEEMSYAIDKYDKEHQLEEKTVLENR